MLNLDAFNTTRLTLLTALLVFIGLVPHVSGEARGVIFFLSGAAYTLVLYLALDRRPEPWRLLAALLILGPASVFVLYAAPLTLQNLPEQVSEVALLVPPSLLGAVVTILVLKFIWRIAWSARDTWLVLTLVLVASLLSLPLSLYLMDLPGYRKITLTANNSLWWLAFSAGIIVGKIRGARAVDSVGD